MKRFFGIAVIATWACCIAAQTFTVVQNQPQAAEQNQPQAVTDSPNATKGSSKSSNKVDASGTGDQMKKSRNAKSATTETTPRKSPVGSTAQSKTKNNTAGSIAGNANVGGHTTGQTKLSRENTQQAPPQGAQTANAQPAQPTPEPKPERKQAPKPVAMSGPAAPPYHAPAWLPQSPDSNTLRTQIQSALMQDESLVGSKVDIVVDDEQVNLAGTVPGSSEKLAAERITRSFAGNRKVVNKLTIGTPTPQPAKAAPAPEKLNSRQSQTANMPAASFAPQPETHPADAPPASANTPQKDPATAGDQSTSPRRP